MTLCWQRNDFLCLAEDGRQERDLEKLDFWVAESYILIALGKEALPSEALSRALEPLATAFQGPSYFGASSAYPVLPGQANDARRVSPPSNSPSGRGVRRAPR